MGVDKRDSLTGKSELVLGPDRLARALFIVEKPQMFLVIQSAWACSKYSQRVKKASVQSRGKTDVITWSVCSRE